MALEKPSLSVLGQDIHATYAEVFPVAGYGYPFLEAPQPVFGDKTGAEAWHGPGSRRLRDRR